MSQTENPKDVTTEQDSLDATLAGILSDALKSYGSTGPEGSVLYIQYWLWVKPAFRSVLTIGTNYIFRIDHYVPCLCALPMHYVPCLCSGGTFPCGISIKVSLAK